MKKLLTICVLGMFAIASIGCNTPASSAGTSSKETKSETKVDGKGATSTKAETKEEKK